MQKRYNKNNSRNSSFSANSSRGRGRQSFSKSKGNKKTYINPDKFIRSAKPVTETIYEPKNLFSDFDVNDLIKKNLEKMGFKKPSAIQDQSIPFSLEGKDIIGIANTGTGKTAAFAIPLLNRLINEPTSKAIVIAPTRELAEQIEKQCREIGKSSKINGALLIGGTNMRGQLADLKYNPRIIIGTPGRIKDHIDRGTLNLSDCNIVVLDEVDRMLDMGFVNDIQEIMSYTQYIRQNLFFSATIDNRVKKIIDSFANDPVQISVRTMDTSENVEQNVVRYRENAEKLSKLHNILAHENTSKVIVFDDTQRMVERLSKDLLERGFSVDAIHGGKNQSQRQRVLRKFKENQINVLIATDVAARGIDISDISHVINYSIPQTYDDYIHRIGRTGRANKTGNALTFVKH